MSCSDTEILCHTCVAKAFRSWTFTQISWQKSHLAKDQNSVSGTRSPVTDTLRGPLMISEHISNPASRIEICLYITRHDNVHTFNIVALFPPSFNNKHLPLHCDELLPEQRDYLITMFPPTLCFCFVQKHYKEAWWSCQKQWAELYFIAAVRVGANDDNHLMNIIAVRRTHFYGNAGHLNLTSLKGEFKCLG